MNEHAGQDKAKDSGESRYNKKDEDYFYAKRGEGPAFNDIEGFEANRNTRGIGGEYSPNVKRVMDSSNALLTFEHNHGTVSEDDTVISMFVVNEGQKLDGKNSMMAGAFVKGCEQDLVKLLANYMDQSPDFTNITKKALALHSQRNLGDLFDAMAKFLRS